MANKYYARCQTCQLSKNNARLRARIRHAKFDRVEGEETLADIAVEVGVSVQAMYNHANKHIYDRRPATEATKIVKTARKIETIKADVQKEAELVVSGELEMEARPIEIKGLDDYIADGVDLVRKGEMKMTPQTWLAAIKIKTDWSKGRDNNKVELIKTMMAFSSGGKKKQLKENLNDTGETSAGDNGGEREARSIYSRAFGGTTPSGADQLPQED